MAETTLNLTQAAIDVLAERRRQVDEEGWTPQHDDGDLAAAAAAYACIAADHLNPHSQGDGGNEAPNFWPFEPGWWRPGEPRRNLVKAGALILSEIERLDRAAAAAPAPSDPAGAGGDLGELERLSKAATPGEWSQDDGSDGGLSLPEEYRIYGDTNGGYLVARVPNFSGYPENEANAAYIVALVNAHRSGQLVASTPGQKGAGEEKTGATPLGSGSRPSDQAASHPAPAGFDPSRRALGSRVLIQVIDSGYYYCAFNEGVTDRISDAFVYDLEEAEDIVRHDCSTLRIIPVPCVSDEHPAGEDAIAAEGEACQRGGEAETPAQTPPSPPSATPEGDPPMTVEEAREVLAYERGRYNGTAKNAAAHLRWRAGLVSDDQDARGVLFLRAIAIELALRTLHAAGEVRHG